MTLTCECASLAAPRKCKWHNEKTSYGHKIRFKSTKGNAIVVAELFMRNEDRREPRVVRDVTRN
jgi:hypothetical protein